MRTSLVTLASALLPVLAPAHGTTSAAGLELEVAGARFGDVCAPPSCQPTSLTLPLGAPVGIATWGRPGTPYLVLVSLTPGVCAPIPGFLNRLAFGPPAFTLYVGGLGGPVPSQCAVRNATIAVRMPAIVPPGFVLLLQSVVFAGSSTGPSPGLAFTNPIVVTLQ